VGTIAVLDCSVGGEEETVGCGVSGSGCGSAVGPAHPEQVL